MLSPALLAPSMLGIDASVGHLFWPATLLHSLIGTCSLFVGVTWSPRLVIRESLVLQFSRAGAFPAREAPARRRHSCNRCEFSLLQSLQLLLYSGTVDFLSSFDSSPALFRPLSCHAKSCLNRDSCTAAIELSVS
jgi:hypothetical protein